MPHDRKGCTELSGCPFLVLPVFVLSGGIVYAIVRFLTQKLHVNKVG